MTRRMAHALWLRQWTDKLGVLEGGEGIASTCLDRLVHDDLGSGPCVWGSDLRGPAHVAAGHVLCVETCRDGSMACVTTREGHVFDVNTYVQSSEGGSRALWRALPALFSWLGR